ncbi:MAG: hypothetical protein DMG38_19805 [Acidobacteria bacterium]|nr:MAG: hypothetical protein DMG38_19805 [Acidobacteriota bacterium]
MSYAAVFVDGKCNRSTLPSNFANNLDAEKSEELLRIYREGLIPQARTELRAGLAAWPAIDPTGFQALPTKGLPILWESGIGSDVMKPIAAPIVRARITSRHTPAA